jgi:NitT/TauT family transport system permease protein
MTGETEWVEEHQAAIARQLESRLRTDRHRADRRARALGMAAPLVSLAVLAVLWELAVAAFAIPTYLLPPPSRVGAVFVERPELLIDHGLVTLIEVAVGFAIAIVVGVAIAIILDASPLIARALNPLLVGSQAMPKIAFAPILVVWFGFGLTPKVLIVFLMAFFPIAISTLVGLVSVEREQILLARSLGMSRIRTFFKIRLPSTMPNLFGGLKIGVTLAVVGAVVGEFVGSDAGLGYLLLLANGTIDTPLLFAGVLSLTIMGLVLYWIVEVVERIVVPWRKAPS